MTAYTESASVAHVMTHAGRGHWRTLCGRGQDLGNPATAGATYDDWRRLRHIERSPYGDPPPSRPWCRFCRRRLQEMYGDVFGRLPAAD